MQIEQLKENDRTKKQSDKETVHNSIHFAQKIEELQFDVVERERKLKDCRLKIIDLKKGNLVLQEAMNEKEKLYDKMVNHSGTESFDQLLSKIEELKQINQNYV